MRDLKFRFVFEHTDSSEIMVSKSYTLDEIMLDDNPVTIEDILQNTCTCDCQPIGETNVVECNCEDYYENFGLKAKLQCTGIKDKNGKEIYEGDIFGNKMLRCVVERQENGEYMLVFLNKKINPISITDPMVKRSEIVGNIHENPELLK